jgi:hypothetical protein
MDRRRRTRRAADDLRDQHRADEHPEDRAPATADDRHNRHVLTVDIRTKQRAA